MTNWADPNGSGEHQWQPPGAMPPPPPQYGQYAPPPPDQGYWQGYGQGYGQRGPRPPYATMVPKPGVVPLRPLVFGDIMEGAFRTVRGNPGATLGLSLLVSCVAAVPLMLITLLLGNVPLGEGSGREVAFLFVQYGGTAITSLVGTVLTGMLIVVVAEAVLGRRISIGATWARVRGRILALLGVVLIVGGAALLIIGSLGLLCWLAYATLGTVALVLAVIASALIALCLLVFVQVRTALASSAVTLERLGPITALKRSWALTQGQFWRILGITLVASLLAGLVASVITVPASVVVGIMAAAAETPGDGLGIGMLLVLQAASLIGTAVTTPFTAGVTGLLYIDQRIRREALDVRLMAEAAKN